GTNGIGYNPSDETNISPTGSHSTQVSQVPGSNDNSSNSSPSKGLDGGGIAAIFFALLFVLAIA
ncbi:26484_t:CDS:1, partial [Racocetra persica]